MPPAWVAAQPPSPRSSNNPDKLLQHHRLPASLTQGLGEDQAKPTCGRSQVTLPGDSDHH